MVEVPSVMVKVTEEDLKLLMKLRELLLRRVMLSSKSLKMANITFMKIKLLRSARLVADND